MPEPSIQNTIEVGAVNIAAKNRVVPGPNGSTTATITANPLLEYVSGGSYAWTTSFLKSLPFYIDDISRDFGDDLYERMMLDPQIASAVRLIISAVTANGIELTDHQTESPEDAQQAQDITDFCRRNLAAMQPHPTLFLKDMLLAVATGNRTAEKILTIPTEGPDKGRICLKAIKAKPRRATAFVVDVYLNVIGILGLIPGQGAPILVEGMIGNPQQVPNLLPRDKFVIFTFRPHNGDPRGTSILRPAYNAWYMKTAIYPEYLKFLTQFASPTLVGTTDEDAQGVPQTDSDGNPIKDVNGNPVIIYPEQVLLAQLQALHNSTAIVVPHGTDIKPLQQLNAGEPFIKAIALFNGEITKGILSQTLATDEGAHESRAASQTHQDVLQLIITDLRETAAAMVESDILRPLIRWNFGDEIAARFTPSVSLADTPTQDKEGLGNVIAALNTSGYIDPSQLEALDILLQLPPRSQDSIDLRIAEQTARLNAIIASPGQQPHAPPPGPAPAAAPGQQPTTFTAQPSARAAQLPGALRTMLANLFTAHRAESRARRPE